MVRGTKCCHPCTPQNVTNQSGDFFGIRSWNQFDFEPKTEGKSTLSPISHCQKIQWCIFKCMGHRVDFIANSSADLPFSICACTQNPCQSVKPFKAAVRMLNPNRCSGYLSAFKSILLPASCLPQCNVVVRAGIQPVGPHTLSKALHPTLFIPVSPAKKTKLLVKPVHYQGEFVSLSLQNVHSFGLISCWCFFSHSLGMISKAQSTCHQRAAVLWSFVLSAQDSQVGRWDTCEWATLLLKRKIPFCSSFFV